MSITGPKSVNRRMKIRLPYGKESIDVDLPESGIEAFIEPNEVSGHIDAVQAVLEALENPSGSGSFQNFLSAAGRLIVIVNDATRPTPTALILETVSDLLQASAAEFIIATGAHRAPAEEELGFIFGSTLERFRGKISVHDARTDEMFMLGTTSRGTEVLLNAKIKQADRILIIGSVEPHYFAGFTGGRKGLLPGVAAFSTIEQNHRLALLPGARTLALSGNPVHEDMLEACRMVDKNIFSIMTVLDRRQQIYSVAAGGLNEAFSSAVEKALEVFAVPIERKADVVIACAKYPMDIDLYQSQKAIENAGLALKPGGTLVLVSACRDGVGDDTFSRLLSSCDKPEAVFSKISEGYRLGYHKAARLAELSAQIRLMAYTGLDPEVLESIFIEPVADLQKLLDELIEAGNRIVIMPDASVTVPGI